MILNDSDVYWVFEKIINILTCFYHGLFNSHVPIYFKGYTFISFIQPYDLVIWQYFYEPVKSYEIKTLPHKLFLHSLNSLKSCIPFPCNRPMTFFVENGHVSCQKFPKQKK